MSCFLTGLAANGRVERSAASRSQKARADTEPRLHGDSLAEESSSDDLDAHIGVTE